MAASTSHGTSGPAPAEIGHAFAVQYYRALKNEPEQLRLFYADLSSLTRVRLTADGRFESREESSPRLSVKDLLGEQHGTGPKVDLSRCSSIETQRLGGSDDSLLVQITGVLEFVDSTCRDFSHTVVLVRQENSFLVVNDILVLSPPRSTVANSISTAAIPAATAPPTLPQEVPTAPHSATRHSAQPAASPLPTTTTPQLATPEGKENLETASSVSISVPAPHAHCPAAPLVEPQLQRKHAEQRDDRTRTASSTKINVDEPDRTAAFSESANSTAKPTAQVSAKHHSPRKTDVASTQETSQPTSKQETRHSNADVSLEEPSRPANVWKKQAPVSSEDVIGQDLKQAGSSSSSSNKSPKASTEKGAAAERAAPFVAPSAAKYTEGSYAHKLLASAGANRIAPPCQVGFAVPPTTQPQQRPGGNRNSNRDNSGNRRDLQRDGGRESGRGGYRDNREPREFRESRDLREPKEFIRDRETRNNIRSAPEGGPRKPRVWVPVGPTGATEEGLRTEVTEQLKEMNLPATARVLRVDRAQRHAYIDFDSEETAAAVIAHGLRVDGRPIEVAFARDRVRRNNDRPNNDRQRSNNNNNNRFHNDRTGNDRPINDRANNAPRARAQVA